MENEEKLIEAFAVVSGDDGFKKMVSDHDIDDIEQKYIVSQVIGVDWSEHDRCEAVGIKYNFRLHRRHKDNRDQTSREGLYFLTKRLLTSDVNEGQDVPDLHQMGDDSDLDSVLKTIIYGDSRATEKVKAIESLVKLQEKRIGSVDLEPWQRIWCDVIIPKLLQSQ